MAKRQSQSLNAGTQVDELSHRMGALRFAAALPSNFPSLVGAAPRPPTASEQQAIKEMLADGFMSIPIFSTEASGLGAGKFVGSVYLKGAIDEDADPTADDEWTLERDTLSVSTRAGSRAAPAAPMGPDPSRAIGDQREVSVVAFQDFPFDTPFDLSIGQEHMRMVIPAPAGPEDADSRLVQKLGWPFIQNESTDAVLRAEGYTPRTFKVPAESGGSGARHKNLTIYLKLFDGRVEKWDRSDLPDDMVPAPPPSMDTGPAPAAEAPRQQPPASSRRSAQSPQEEIRKRAAGQASGRVSAPIKGPAAAPQAASAGASASDKSRASDPGLSKDKTS